MDHIRMDLQDSTVNAQVEAHDERHVRVSWNDGDSDIVSHGPSDGWPDVPNDDTGLEELVEDDEEDSLRCVLCKALAIS